MQGVSFTRTNAAVQEIHTTVAKGKPCNKFAAAKVDSWMMNNSKIFAIVLAAGKAERFGSTKQLATFEGEPLVRRAVRTAESVCFDRTIVVTGSDWQRVATAGKPRLGFFLNNPNFARGMGVSLSQAVGAISSIADAVLITLADQPLVTTDHLEELCRRWENSRQSIVASGFDDMAAPPVIFPRTDFASLQTLDDDRGARKVLSDHADRVINVNCEAAALDIDVPNDLERLRSSSGRKHPDHGHAPHNARS